MCIRLFVGVLIYLVNCLMYNNQCDSRTANSLRGRKKAVNRERDNVEMERAYEVVEKSFYKWQTKVVNLKNGFFSVLK